MKPLFLLALIVLNTTFVLAQTQTKPSRPATITGRVLDEDGQPLGGANVSALRAGSATPQGVTTTDAEGKFKISNLSPSAYSIFANHAPYVSRVNAMMTFYRPGEDITITLVKGGVITGKILNAQGDPVPGMMATATRMRDGEGRSLQGRTTTHGIVMADDRGVYRIFGLPPGSYFISVRNNGNFFFGNDPEIQIYYPATTMDGAEEVTVAQGAEVSGIDIHVRHERGHRVSGFVSGAVASTLGVGVPVRLTSVATGVTAANIMVQPRAGNLSFVLPSVPDGEYELTASRTVADRSANDVSAFSVPRKITVQGRDVTGIELKLLLTATVSGRVVVEPLPTNTASCLPARATSLEEVLIAPTTANHQPTLRPTTPDAQGNFVLHDFPVGRFRLTTEWPSAAWYLKAITRQTQSWHEGVDVQTSEQIKDVTITLAAGAASLRGRVTGKASHVYLIPAERNDALRYAGTKVRDDATFAFRQLAPGNYWLLTRSGEEAEPLWFNAERRTELRRAAEAAKQTITLKPCQSVQNYTLKVVP